MKYEIPPTIDGAVLTMERSGGLGSGTPVFVLRAVGKDADERLRFDLTFAIEEDHLGRLLHERYGGVDVGLSGEIEVEDPQEEVDEE